MPLSEGFRSNGPNSATCLLCGTRVKRNALAYSGHVRGKAHQSELARRELLAMAKPAPAPIGGIPARDVAYLQGKGLAHLNPSDAQVETIAKGSTHPDEFMKGYRDGVDAMTEG